MANKQMRQADRMTEIFYAEGSVGDFVECNCTLNVGQRIRCVHF